MSSLFCPICGARETLRERRPNGNSRCGTGHSFPSREAIEFPAVARRQAAIESAYQYFTGVNPAVSRDDIETAFDQLAETRPTVD